MSKVLVIDDSDPEVIYTGSWTKEGFVSTNNKEYSSTVHRSGAAGDKLSYTFHGSMIAVYGTIEKPASYGAPSASFSVDGGTSTAFNSTGSVLVTFPTSFSSHILLYRSSVLPVDSHTLTIEIGTPKNTAAHLYVDFFTISTDSDNVSGDIIYDERDPLVTYTGTWKESGGVDEYMHTATRAPSTDAGGSATFHFTGSSVSVFGSTSVTTAANTTAKISFDIDGVSSGTWTGSQNSPVTRNNLFFHKDGLSDTQEHSIVMKTLNNNGWYLDYIIVHSTATMAVSTTSLSASASTSTVSASALSGLGAPSAGGTNSQTNSGIAEPLNGSIGTETGDSSAKGGPNVGAIAGAAAGCVIGVIVIAGIIFMLLRRRKSRQSRWMEYADGKYQANQFPGTYNAPIHLTPVSSRVRGGSSTYSGTLFLDTVPADSHSPPHNEQFINEKSRMSQARNTLGATQVIPMQAQSRRTTSHSGISSGGTVQSVEAPRRAVDGGVRLQSADDDDHDDTLPPSYARY